MIRPKKLNDQIDQQESTQGRIKMIKSSTLHKSEKEI